MLIFPCKLLHLYNTEVFGVAFPPARPIHPSRRILVFEATVRENVATVHVIETLLTATNSVVRDPKDMSQRPDTR